MNLRAKLRSVRSEPGGALRKAGFRLAGVVGKHGYQRFVIVCRSRSGSNMLLSMLDANPAIWAEGEILQRLDGRDPTRVVSKVFRRRVPRHIDAVGFKLFYYHPVDTDPDPTWDVVRGIDDLRVIHLTRRNLVRALVSRSIAERSGNWLERGGRRPASSGDAPAVTVDPTALRREVEQTWRWRDALASRLPDAEILDVVYEDLVRAPEAELRRITDFLGVAAGAAQTRTRRQNPESLRELVANFDELVVAFEGTDLADMLD